MSLTEYDEQEQMELFREEGEKRGIERGMEFGLERGDAQRLIKSVEAVMRNFKVDLETACRGSDVTVEQYLKAKERMEHCE